MTCDNCEYKDRYRTACGITAAPLDQCDANTCKYYQLREDNGFKWVSVEDALPEYDKEVLAYVHDNSTDGYYYYVTHRTENQLSCTDSHGFFVHGGETKFWTYIIEPKDL